ncbi:MAG TPA: hypothetical protein PKA28_03610 [Methylomusa anaerophila]|uniref:Uncharacterized protein n=1 Tax=Methylomusa anaerophila TaxID=1930071 RepID=A0A348ANI4_9FIRM|nr:hypothetical protein [Methylomusa anaerophila]BBB92632.1 hypothetical protein MAMMFC1_03327 [Methylomusa anaerophila]HML87514.1 hypothetical protein [Methylomusa anaerophila]
MAVKPQNKPQSGRRNHDENIQQEKAEVRYFKGEEQFERWRKEFIQHQDYELKLGAVSKLVYEQVDYEPFLERITFPELVLTDYEYLYEQNRKKIETQFMMPIASRIGILAILAIAVAVLFNVITLWITVPLAVAAAFSLYIVFKTREEALEESHIASQAEIERRHAEEIKVYEEAKSKHETEETTRIENIQRLLEGEPGAIGLKIDETLSQMRLPVIVEVDVDFHVNIPLITVWLPPKAVVPRQTCELLPSGRIQYQDKEPSTFNKQYFELCAAIILQVTADILSRIPTFEHCYACGMAKTDINDECVITFHATREEVAGACQATNSIMALQILNASYECDTSLGLKAVEMKYPPEWEGLDQQMLRTVHVRIYK